jgi:hypothetical protein
MQVANKVNQSPIITKEMQQQTIKENTDMQSHSISKTQKHDHKSLKLWNQRMMKSSTIVLKITKTNHESISGWKADDSMKFLCPS